MRDPKRIGPALERIREVWERHPDMRLGQLLLAALFDDELFYIEDAALLNRLEHALRKP